MAKNSITADTAIEDGWEVQSLESEDGDKNKKDSNVNENTSSTSSSKKRLTSGSSRRRKRSHDKGRGHYLTRSLWRVFSNPGSTPPGGRVTPEDSGPASPKKAFGRRSSKRTDELIMKTISDYGSRNKSLNNSAQNLPTQDNNGNVSHYFNPSYIPTYLDEDDDLSSNSLRSRNRHSYQAQIYSVNSAGNPVPITIEESENEDDGEHFRDYEKSPDSVTDDVALQESSPDENASRNCGQNGCCFGLIPKTTSSKICRLFRPIWYTTYRPDSSAIFYWLLVVTICYLYNLWTIPLRATFYEGIVQLF